MENKIIVKGARTHNLKNITVEMPRNKMIAFTGLSGSGKSSLAFDTIFAEGQRRYVESLSAYARQFLRQMQKPDVDEIVGLSPSISIDQKSRSNNPRSTVATITQIYDYMRILYARIGRPHCLTCGREIKKLSPEEIMDTILNTIRISASAVSGGTDEDKKIRILAPVVVGRKGEYYQLLYDFLSKGYERVKVDGAYKDLRKQIIMAKNKKHNIDLLIDEISGEDFQNDEMGSMERLSEALERALNESDGLVKIERGEEEHLISAKFMCPYDGFSYPEIEPRLFSFNSPHGACNDCHGLGTKHLFGDDPCPACDGARLRREALNVFVGRDKEERSIVDFSSFSIKNAKFFLENLKLTSKEEKITQIIKKEILSRLQFMIDVGLEYITLDRRANTISGGEAQRIRLASQLGSGLVGALYVLDEPTIGLHQRDNDRLIKTLLELRDLGNTIIVVEHDESTIQASDYLVDLGAGAGVHGGEVIVSGDLNKLLAAKKNVFESSTLAYLRGEKDIAIPKDRRKGNKGVIKVRNGKVFNLQNVSFDLPLGRLSAITGVSGSGKSTILYEILHKNFKARFDRRYRSNKTFNCKSITGTEYLGRSILIDQSPIGRTPRSNPATYTGAFTFIRDLFASTNEAKARGWRANRFSFNVKGGRCEACQGNGLVAVEMHFLPTVYVKCDICSGKRFMKETLDVKYKKRNIHDVLEMSIEDACLFFEDIPAIHDRVKTLSDVGLGYLRLGQSATTLSGGEAQRVKISSELYRPFLQKTIYLFDEPTIGLHYDDVQKLIEILQKLVSKGNTVVVIEHNMDIIKNADYIIDVGPEGGDQGGKIVAKGTPEEVIKVPHSYTGKYLKKVLKK